MTTPKINTETPDATTQRFIEYALDAENWNGTPLVGGNVGGDKEDAGYLLNMKKRGLIETFETRDGQVLVWVKFTEAGKELLAAHNVWAYGDNF